MIDLICFDGGIVVIIGVVSGIGSGLVCYVVVFGMCVVLVDFDLVKFDVFVVMFDIDVLCVLIDVSWLEVVDVLVEVVWWCFGGVDLLFNNVGVMVIGFSWEIMLECFECSFVINVYGVLNGICSFVLCMFECNVLVWVVNIVLVGGFLLSLLMLLYLVMKFVVVVLMELLYGELKMFGVLVGVLLFVLGFVLLGIFNDLFGVVYDWFEVCGFVDMMCMMLNVYGFMFDVFVEWVFDGICVGCYWLIL